MIVEIKMDDETDEIVTESKMIINTKRLLQLIALNTIDQHLNKMEQHAQGKANSNVLCNVCLNLRDEFVEQCTIQFPAITKIFFLWIALTSSIID